jgi:hypothetical protein
VTEGEIMAGSPPAELDDKHEAQGAKTPRKAAISSWIGSALEYYDFFIHGTAAALVSPKVFFPAGNPAAATVASLATCRRATGESPDMVAFRGSGAGRGESGLLCQTHQDPRPNRARSADLQERCGPPLPADGTALISTLVR